MEEKPEEDKVEKKKARKALILLLGKLRKKCGTYQSVNDWLVFVKQELDPIITEFKAQIPPDSLKALENAKHITSFSKEAVNQACNNLQLNIEKIIKILPASSPLIPPILVAVGLTAGIGAAAALYLNAKAVSINIKNNRCDTIKPVTYVPVKLPGLSLFADPILDGGTQTIKLLPIPVTVNATQTGTILIRISGLSIPLPGTENISAASSITFDGEELLGKETALNLGKSAAHNLIITCR